MMLSEAQVSLFSNFLDRNKRWASPEDVIKLARFYLHDQLKVLESALEVLDSESRITCFESRHADNITEDANSRRSFWRVPAATSEREPYTCTRGGCDCPRYTELAKNVDENHEPMCKHIIAVYIGTALGLVDVTIMPCHEFVKHLTDAGARRKHNSTK